MDECTTKTDQLGRQGGNASNWPNSVGAAGLVLHSRCQLASWAFVAVLITVLPGVGGENSPRGTVSSGTLHQEANNCFPAQLGGIPPHGSEGRGCGRVLPSSAHAHCRAERTCLRLALRLLLAPARRRGAGEPRRCSGATASSPTDRPSAPGSPCFFFFPAFLFSLEFPGESVLFYLFVGGRRIGTGGSEGIRDKPKIAWRGGKYAAFQTQ